MIVTLITGTSSGIGRATAVLLASRGHTVYATMRDTAKSTKLLGMAEAAGTSVRVVALDVTDDDSVRAGVGAVMADAGRIDVLINNAGIGYNAVVEDLDIERMKSVYDTNVFGAVRCTKAVLPGMRERGSGHIVNVTSIAGRVTAPAQAAYTSSKFAFEAISEHLAQEVSRYGIRVSIIEPGVTRTAILAKNDDFPADTLYQWAYAREFAFYAAGIVANVQPGVVAETIWEAMTTDAPKLRWRCAWACAELDDARRQMSDEDWVALAGTDSDDDYYDGFEAAFGLDIRPA